VGFHREDSFSGGPSKELPSRINRQRRSAERRELSQALHHDISTSSVASSTKCAATQTIISTVRHEANEFVGIPSLNPAFPPPSSSSLVSHIPLGSPPPPMHPAFILDMRQQSRPSVINKAPSTSKDHHQDGRENGHVDRENRRNGLRNSRLENFHVDAAAGKPSGLRRDRRTFQTELRSELPRGETSGGQSFEIAVEVMPLTPPASASLPNTSPPVSISGSVDDHFAKAWEISGVESRRRWNRAPHGQPSIAPKHALPAALTSQVFKHTSFVSS
ncbi:putative transcription cofactor vestigial-like protein 4 isoform X1, partial [Apostichopus japonicus]